MIGVSDNGGPVQGGQGANNYPLRSGKFSSFEGVGTHHPSQHILQLCLWPVSNFSRCDLPVGSAVDDRACESMHFWAAA